MQTRVKDIRMTVPNTKEISATFAGRQGMMHGTIITCVTPPYPLYYGVMHVPCHI